MTSKPSPGKRSTPIRSLGPLVNPAAPVNLRDRAEQMKATRMFYENRQWQPPGITQGLTGPDARNAVGYYWQMLGKNPEYQAQMIEQNKAYLRSMDRGPVPPVNQFDQADNQLYMLPVDTATKMFGDISAFQRSGDNVFIPAEATKGLSTYTPPQQDAEEMKFGVPKSQWDTLPGWQKAVIPALPYTGAVIGGGTALIGLLSANPIVAAMGLGMAGLGEMSKSNPTLANVLNFLDIPAEGVERTVGLASQIIDSVLDPDTYGPVGEVLNNLPAAWQAGHLAYNVATLGSMKWDPAQQQETIYNWKLGQATPEEWTVSDGKHASSLALAEARRRLANSAKTGETTQEIWDDISSRFGFASDVREMIGHMIIDPLNLIGDVQNYGLFKYGKAVGNTDLARSAQQFSQLATAEENFRLARRGVEASEWLRAGNPNNNDITDALKMYGMTVRRSWSPEEAAKAGAFTRWLADLDKQGNWNIYNQDKTFLGGVTSMLMDSARGLTPQARAAEVLDTYVNGIGMTLASGYQSPEDVVKLFYSMSRLDPKGAVTGVDGLNIPKWFSSAETQHLPQALRDLEPEVKKSYLEWVASTDARNTINSMAQDIGKDPYEIIRELHRADAKSAEETVRAILTDLKTRDPKKLQSYLQGGITPAKLKAAADLFSENIGAFDPEAFKGKFMEMVGAHVDKWSAQWFNVKPIGWVNRLGNTVKRAQSLVLLGLNPTFMVRNFMDNIAVMAYEGVLGFSTSAGRKKFMAEMGFTPTRLRQGMSAADIGELGENLKLGKAIRAASRKDGSLLTAVDDSLRKMDKLAIFSNGARNIESWSSEIAMTNAMKQFWERNWREGVGFDRMPDDLARVLDGVYGKGTSERVMKLIRRGKTREQIEKQIFKNWRKQSLGDVLNPDEMELFNHFPGLYDDLDKAIQAATSSGDIRRAFQDANQKARDAISQMVQRNAQARTEAARAKVVIEGGGARSQEPEQPAARPPEPPEEPPAPASPEPAIIDETGGAAIPPPSADELARMRAEKRKLRAEEKAGWTRTADGRATVYPGNQEGIAEGDKYNGGLSARVLAFDEITLERANEIRPGSKPGDEIIIEVVEQGYGPNAEIVVGYVPITSSPEPSIAAAPPTPPQPPAPSAAQPTARHAKGALDLIGDMTDQLADFWDSHFEFMAETATQAAGMDADGARLVWMRAFEQAEHDWQEFNTLYDDTFLGIFRGLGASDETLVRLQLLIGEGYDLPDGSKQMGLRSIWGMFYAERLRLLREAADQAAGLPKKEAQRIHAETQKILNDLYLDSIIDEERVSIEMDNLFAEQYSVAVPEADALERALEWTGRRGFVRRQMAAVQALYRNNGVYPPKLQDAWGDVIPRTIFDQVTTLLAGGDMGVSRRDIQKKFYDQIYTPYIDRLRNYADGADPDNPNPMAPRTPPEAGPDPAAPEMEGAARVTEPEAPPPPESATPEEIDANEVDRLAAEAQQADEIARANRQGVYKVAAEYGIGSDTAGDYVHILNILKQYFRVTDINQVTEAMAREAFEKRSLFKGAVDRDAQKVLDRRLLEWRAKQAENNQALRLAEVAESIQGSEEDFAKEMEAHIFRDAYARELAKGYSPADAEAHARDITAQKSGAVMDIQNAIADYWAQQNGKSRADYYKNLRLISQDRPGGEGLFQLPPMEQVAHRYKTAAEKVSRILMRSSEGWDGTEGALFGTGISEHMGAANRRLENIDQMGLAQSNKGLIKWLDNGMAVIRAYEAADVSTFVHEISHAWLPNMGEGDLQIVSTWLRESYDLDLPDGWQYGHQNYTQAKELFARGFERYLAEGRAPVPMLRRVFENFRKWMIEIYNHITDSDIDVKLTDEVRGLFDRWLGQEKPVGEMTREELTYIATHDKMTGLKNRRGFENDPRKAWVVLMDVEGLKWVNDTYGHDVGDQVMRALGRAVDQVAGEGQGYRGSERGDEFMMQFDQEADARAAAEQVQTALRGEHIRINGQDFNGLGLSFGVGKYNPKEGINSGIRAADQELIKNKEFDTKAGRRSARGEKPTNLQAVTPETPVQASPGPGQTIRNVAPGERFYFAGTVWEIDTVNAGWVSYYDTNSQRSGMMHERMLVEQSGKEAKPIEPSPETPAQIAPEPAAEIRPTQAPGAPTIRTNAEKGGIEVVFAEKPDRNVIDRLKAAGFRWSSREKLWYVKDTERARNRLAEIFGGSSLDVDKPAFIPKPIEPSPVEGWPTREQYQAEHPMARQSAYELMIEEALAQEMLSYEDALKLADRDTANRGMLQRYTQRGWKMTRREYITAVEQHGKTGTMAGKEHEALVRAALMRKEAVPDNVLVDYPDLAITNSMDAPAALSRGDRVTKDGRIGVVRSVDGKRVMVYFQDEQVEIVDIRTLRRAPEIKATETSSTGSGNERYAVGDKVEFSSGKHRFVKIDVTKIDVDGSVIGVDGKGTSYIVHPFDFDTIYKIGGKPVQENFFQQGEDLPLFSQTAQSVEAETFKPQETGGQGTLFDTREQLPTIEPKVVEGETQTGPLFESPLKVPEYTEPATLKPKAKLSRDTQTYLAMMRKANPPPGEKYAWYDSRLTREDILSELLASGEVVQDGTRIRAKTAVDIPTTNLLDDVADRLRKYYADNPGGKEWYSVFKDNAEMDQWTREVGGISASVKILDDLQAEVNQPPVMTPITIKDADPLPEFMGRLATKYVMGEDFPSSRAFEEYAQSELGLDMNDEVNLNLAYDALEGAFNMLARDMRAEFERTNTPLSIQIDELAQLEKRLVQARRTIRKMELQQFSTPLPIAHAASYAADVRPGDVVTEVTAGTANLVDALNGKPGVVVQVNDIDPGRRRVMSALGYTPTDIDIESPAWLIKDGKIQPPHASVMISNPPWGSYNTGRYGRAPMTPVELNDWSQRFAYLSLRRLADGGRYVGVMPTNWLFTIDRTTRETKYVTSAFYKWLDAEYNIRAVIESPPGAYKQRGTDIGSLLIVVDKSKTKSPTQLKAFGQTAPRDWKQYASYLEMLGEGKLYGRSAADIETSQRGIAVRAEAAINAQRPASGPDATGLVDPNARAGKPEPDAANIGRPGTTAAPTRPEPAAGGTARIPEPGRPDAGAQPPAVPVERTPPTGGISGAGDRGRTDGGPVGQPGSGDAANAGQPAGSGGGAGPAVVEGQPAGVRPGVQPGERPAQDQPAQSRPGAQPATGGEDRTTDRYVESAADAERRRSAAQAVEQAGAFTLYVARSPLPADAKRNPHPSTVVETKALSGIKAPDLEEAYKPHDLVMQAYERGDLSLEGQLDPIWAAVQQNDKHGSAMMVADDVGMGKSRTAAGFVLDRIGKGRKRILVVTADARNITNLMESEFPTIGGGKFPARFELVSGEMLPDVKKGKVPLPTYEEPTVYFLNFYQFPDFARAIIDAHMDAVVIDEVHKFRNVNGADYGEAWKALHQDWIANKTSMLYLSATPGVDIIDLEYLYGLKIWTMDGFGDWVKVLTGELSPEQLTKVQSTIDALAKYSMDIAEKVRALGLEEVSRRIDGANEIGYDLGHNLFVRESSGSDAYLVLTSQSQSGQFYEVGRIGSGDKNTVLLVADRMIKQGPPTDFPGLRQAYAESLRDFHNENPAPKVDSNTLSSLGIKDASDAAEAAVERKKKRFGSRTAFESTLPPEHTEQIIRELKVGGYYMSRDISRAGVVFGVEKVNITQTQIDRQNKRIQIYRRIIEASHKYGKMNKADKIPTVMGHIQNDAKRLLFDMRLTDTMRLADEALARGEHVVISTVSVGDVVAGADAELDVSALREAGISEKEIRALVRASEDKARKAAEKSAKSRSKQNQKRAEQGLPPIEEGGEEERGYLYAAVNSINTQKIEKIGSGDSATFSNPEDIPEAMVEILEIKEMIREMGTVPSPIDVLRAHYGDRIGFITGAESDKQRLATMAEFQADRLDVVLISKAGKTGINLHDVTGKHRRHLISADYEWSATDFKQELGRVDRTGQRSSPYVTVLHSGNAAEVKFISTIANRMKGLGATSKGGAESTGTGALNDQFELGSDIDKMALSLIWRDLDPGEKSLFLDPYFKDKKARDRVAYLRDIPKSAESIKKFTLALQSIPLKTANEFLERWMNKIADLQTAANAINEAETMGKTGEILRKTELSSGLILNEVKAQSGHRYGVLTGVLTPHMKTLSDALIGNQARSFNIETGRFSDDNWRHWVNFNDNVNGEWASGLEIPPGKLERIAKDFGAKLASNRTPETVMIDMRAGDKVPIRGLGGAEWNMYIGRGGYREGKVVVDGAKIGQRADIMPHGAAYDARGSFFYVPEENLQTFLKRFPIDNDRAGLAQPVEGGKALMYGPDGSKYSVQYKVVPLADLIASHGITFDPDPRYPSGGVQPRDRSGTGYRNQVTNIARNLDEQVLVHSPEMTFGAPITSGNVVVNGNGRVMGMRLAQRDYPERWNYYQTYLREHMADFGLTPESMEGIKDPVLVREVLGDVDLTKLGQQSQVSNSAQLSALERAFVDKTSIDPKLIGKLEVGENESIEGALNKVANRDIVDAWLRTVPESERPSLVAESGDLSGEGLARLKYALFAYVFPGDAGQRIARLFLQNGSESVRNIEQAIFDTLGTMAQMESLIRSGAKEADLSISGDLEKAVDVLVRLKQTKMSVSDYVRQTSIEGDELNPMQKQLLIYLDQNSRSRKRVRDLFVLYADNVINVQPDPNQMGLFGGARSTKGEILDAAAEQVTGQHGEFAAIENKPPEPAPSPEPEVVATPAATPEAAGPAEPPAKVPLGTADSLNNPPVDQAIYEGWMKNVQPMMQRAENALIGQQKQIPVGLGDDPKAMPADVRKGLQAYIGKVGGQLGDAKIGAMRWGEAKRDAALLNYARRYEFDNWLGTVMPYEFYYTRAMRNWARRALTKPAIYANYMRLRQFGQRSIEQEGFPTRLKKKMGIKIPFMPKWMGDGVYIDPLRSVFPFEQLAQPWETWATQQNQEMRRAEGIIQQMVADEEITAEEGQQALSMRDGYVWKKALTRAQAEVEGDIQNPMDLAFTMVAPSLPIQMAYNMMTGRKDRISQLPITRGVQAVTGALGIGGARGVNLESGVRKTLGLPEVDRFEDYRVDRMLVNLVAEGVLSAQDAKLAMIDRQGPAFEEAQRRVSQMGFWQYVGAPLGLDMFPEGEQEVRALKGEYDKAIGAWKGGDTKALTKFFDRYPEYEARMASFQEPDERLKRFLISEVWDRYNAMPALYKRQAREQLGDLFTDAFVNKETRSYDSINTETIAAWAKAMSDMPLPNKTPDTASISLQFAPSDTAKAVEEYNSEADARFPGIGQFLASFYQLPQEQQDAARRQFPQINAYYSWKNRYLAEHPDVIPWITSDKSELFGLPQDLQAGVYKYRAQREELFPGIDQVQDGYYQQGIDQKAYLKQHPELREYWDWRKAVAAQTPKLAPYILSDQALQNALLNNQSMPISREAFDAIDPIISKHLLAYFYAREPLRAGVLSQLDDIWEEQGKPYGELMTWINKAVRPALTGY